jgi:hypothetical protein
VPVGAVDILDDEAEQGRDEGLQRDLAWSWRAGRQPMGKPGARPPPGRGGTGRR